MRPTIPDILQSKEWNEKRQALEEKMAEAVCELVSHMGTPGSISGKFDLMDPGGRPITLIIEAGARPRSH